MPLQSRRATEEDPPAAGEPSWTELRDCVLAALQMVRRAEGWEIVSIARGLRRHVQPRPWLRDPVQAEAHIDEAAVAVMGLFAPVDRAVMAAARFMPGVCAVFVSSSVLLTTRTP